MRTFFRCTYLAGLSFRDGGISILSYHSIDDFGTPLSVSPRRFAAQMAALAGEGCATLTMAEVARHLQAGMPFPRRAVAITFDDGFESVAAIAPSPSSPATTSRPLSTSSRACWVTEPVGRTAGGRSLRYPF